MSEVESKSSIDVILDYLTAHGQTEPFPDIKEFRDSREDLSYPRSIASLAPTWKGKTTSAESILHQISPYIGRTKPPER